MKNERKLSRFNRLMLWLNYFAIVSLLIGVFSKYISPEFVWPIAFFGLAFPFLFLINLCFAVYWTIQFRRTALFSILAFVISIPTASKYLQFNVGSDDVPEKSLRITSYNSMLFDLYNWKKNKETREKIFTDLAEINSDVYCFQEFYTSEEEGDFNNTDSLTKLLGLKEHHVEYTTTLREKDHWGIATFSKYPIINRGKIMFNTRNNNMCIYSDIVVNKDTIRIYNVHLQSISFSKKDNDFLNDIKKGNDPEEELEKSKNILRRLKRAFVKRAKQVEAIQLHMKGCKYKIILCGDFNDTPASYTYQQLTTSLKDAFVEQGSGFGKTYAGQWPQFRIDYILLDKKLGCNNYQRAEDTYTDHYPIFADIYHP